MRKRIGIISAGWNDEYQRKIVTGVTNACEKYDYDTVSLTSNNIDYTSEVQNRCAYNIYNLINEKYLDGIVLVLNPIYYPEIISAILKKTEEMHIPAVSVDLEYEDMLYVGTDNYNSARVMVEHLLENESCTRFACLTGVSFNPESEARVQAFKDAVTEKKGGYQEHYIFQGNFQPQCGVDAANYWHGLDADYPDAVFCANDASARGFLDRTLELGYRVPEDVKIVSFDNTFNGRYARVPLSSMGTQLELLGEKAADMLKAYFEGGEVKDKELVPGVPFFRESSGCSSVLPMEDYRELYEKSAVRSKDDERYLFWANLMTDQFSFCDTFDEVAERLKVFIEHLKCDGFYVCFTQEQMEAFSDKFQIDEQEKKERIGYMLEGYSPYMYMPIVYEGGEFLEPKVFETEKILDVLDRGREKRVDYVIFPLYYMGKTHGYCAIGNCNTMAYSVAFQTWLAFFAYGVNNLLMRQELDRKAKELEFLHERDSMTGAYNRRGFSRHSTRMMQQCVKNGTSMMILFADLDDMKNINDRYGHDEGDKAICAFCNTVMSVCEKGEIVSRFGGDEMVVFGIDYTDELAEDFTRRLQEAIDRYNEEAGAVFELRVSTGYYVEKPDENTSMDKCINNADANMYQEKYRRKKYFAGRSEGIHSR